MKVMLLERQTARKPGWNFSRMTNKAPPLPEYINGAFGGDTIETLVALADQRDDLVKSATGGSFPDVITGCVDICMALVEALLAFADSIDAASAGNEEQMRAKSRAFILSVLDAVYGPNCVRITVYNPEVDWNTSVWQIFPVMESPSSRHFLNRAPSQSDTVIQWLDLKSRLLKQCRNPKREAQRMNKVAALEDELQGLALRHAAMIERFIKIQQGEKDPEAAQALRDASAKRLAERKGRYDRVISEKHCVSDPAVRKKRDALLWGGQPHIAVTAAALNNSTLSKAASVGERVRRMSRFGFRSEADEDDIDDSSDTSSPGDEEQAQQPPMTQGGCLSMFRCCVPKPDKRSRRKVSLD